MSKPTMSCPRCDSAIPLDMQQVGIAGLDLEIPEVCPRCGAELFEDEIDGDESDGTPPSHQAPDWLTPTDLN